MAQDREPIDVGQEIAELLLEWRPSVNAEDVAVAFMYALERYSLQSEGGMQVGLSSCLYVLKQVADQELRR